MQQCLNCTLLAVQVTAGLGFFSAFTSFNLVKIVTPCSINFGFLAGPWWDSEIEADPVDIVHHEMDSAVRSHCFYKSL